MSSFIIVLFIVFCGAITASEVCIGKCPKTSLNNSIVFLPNVNCSKYCVCDHGRPVEMQCPANLHFSPEYNTCADPEQANCVDLTSTTQANPEEAPNLNNYLRKFDSNSLLEINSRPGIRYNTYCANPLADCRNKPLICIGECPSDYADQIYLLAHEDCTKYCKCSNKVALTKDCPEDFHFNIDIGMCTTPVDAQCDRVNGIITTTTTISPEPFYKCVSECPRYDNADLVVLVAHELCEKYCHCKNGIAKPKDCPLHLHFSLPHGTCVDPNIAQCYNNNTNTEKPTIPPTPPTPPTPKPTTPPTPKPTTPPTPKPTIPPTPKPTTPPTPKPTIPPIPKPTIPPTPPTPKPTDEPDKLGCIGTCPLDNDPTHTSQLPHINCNKFCKCDWGKPSVMFCPPPLLYNPMAEVCDYPYAAGCTENQRNLKKFSFTKNKNYHKKTNSTVAKFISQLELDTADCIGTCLSRNDPTKVFQLPHKYCNKFCKCQSEKLSVYECPYLLFYNPVFQVCDNPYLAGCIGIIPSFEINNSSNKFLINYNNREQNASTADCVEPCPFTNPLNETVHVAHKDCTKFCKCSFGTAWVMDCPKDLYFNPKEQVCDFKFNVHCDENGPWVDEINGKYIDQSQTNNVENSIWQNFKDLFHHYDKK